MNRLIHWLNKQKSAWKMTKINHKMTNTKTIISNKAVTPTIIVIPILENI